MLKRTAKQKKLKGNILTEHPDATLDDFGRKLSPADETETEKGVSVIPPSQQKSKRGLRAYLLLAVVTITGGGVWSGFAYYTRNLETTEEAFVDADVVALSTRINGEIQQVDVADNQRVHAGDQLLKIDQAPFLAKLQQAEAQLAVARAEVDSAKAQLEIAEAGAEGGKTIAEAEVSNAQWNIGGADAAVSSAEALVVRANVQAENAASELQRARQLAASGAIPAADLERQERDNEIAQAQLIEAEAQLTLAHKQVRVARSKVKESQGRLRQSEPVSAQLERAKAQLELTNARVRSAEAAVALARIDLDSTSVTASISGTVTRLAARPGQMVQTGQLLLYIVPDEQYIVANFKETQIGRMRPGQPVEVVIDAFPGKKFKGRIDSIMAGTGSRFSLLPSNNATGNFVKVVQRVPIRITWQRPPDVVLAPGLSTEVTVDVGPLS